MFANEYVMDSKRYSRWTCPIITKAKGFWFWVAVLAFSTVALVILYQQGARNNFKSLAALLALVSVYRGFLFRPMYVNKQFRLMARQRGKDSWECKVIIQPKSIMLYVDGKYNNEIEWRRVKAVVEAQSYIDLAVDEDFVRLDKAGFTQGDTESFLAYMKQEHPDIAYRRERPEFDR